MKPICLTVLAALGLTVATIDAKAQTWPTKPIRARKESAKESANCRSRSGSAVSEQRR